MEKILQRTRMAERQVARRRAVLTRVTRNEELRTYQSRLLDHLREVRSQRQDAIRARRESWEMGALAPRRDVPMPDPSGYQVASPPAQWGSISASRAQLDGLKLPGREAKARCAWAGGPQYLCLAVGDRVAVIEGHQKGTIAVVTQIDIPSATLYLEEQVKSNITLPPYYRAMTETGKAGVALQPVSIPISAVRLVHPITDPATGTTRDVVIRQLRPTDISHDRLTRSTTWSRMVPGLNVTIPWPAKKDETKKDHPSDTLRLQVEERTFVPTLLRPPMPASVIDELRGRYSVFRTRHTPEYVAQKIAEQNEKKERWRLTVEGMATPLQEFHRQQRALRRARGQPVLTEEMLAKIGEVMARNKAINLKAGGMTQVTSGIEGLSLETPSEQSRPPPPTSG